MQEKILNLKLKDFDGPMDLILVLIKNNKMSIEDLDILKITDQYLNFVYSQDELGIDNFAEYLFIASTLIFMKSKIMKNSAIKLSDSEQIELDNEKQKLINQILTYKKYKDITPKLNDLYHHRQCMYIKKNDDVEKIINKRINKEIFILPQQMKLDVLKKAMEQAYEKWRLNIFNNHQIIIQEVSAEQVEKEISYVLSNHTSIKKYSLSDFFKLVGINNLSLQYLVTCFVCLLDLAKNNIIRLSQNNFDDEIYFEVL